MTPETNINRDHLQGHDEINTVFFYVFLQSFIEIDPPVKEKKGYIQTQIRYDCYSKICDVATMTPH